MTSTSSDVADPRKEHELNTNNLLTFLRSHHIAQPQENISIKAFSHGQSNPTYLITLTTTGQKMVLRKAPPGKIISKTAHRMDREFQILKALYDLKSSRGVVVPVPRPLALCMDSQVLGSPFYCMEFKQGRVFKDVKMPELSTVGERREAWFSIMDSLASLHDVDIKAAGLETFGPTTEYFVRQVKSLSKVSQAQREVDIEHVPVIPDFDSTGARIAKAVIQSLDEPNACIVHGDFKADNVIISETNPPRVIAIIDWEMSTTGAFGADLANVLTPFYLTKENPIFFALNGVDDMSVIGLSSRDELVERYCAKRTHPKLNADAVKKRMLLYVAFYLFKTAVILQGVAARALKGQASSARAELVGKLAPHAGDAARQLMDEFESGNMRAGKGRL